MSKRYTHWNDGKYKPLPDQFQTGILADRIQKDLVSYLFNDVKLEKRTDIQKHYLIKRYDKMVDYIETICHILRDGNSINAKYDVDYEQRRIRWLAARGYCFRLMSLLDTLSAYLFKDTNIQKYVVISDNLFKLSGKIQNLIVSDDKRRKQRKEESVGSD